MSKLSVGIVNYGVGNLASVRHCLQELDFRCRVSDDTAVLSGCDLLLLPGVGAFPLAMKALQACGLDRYLVEQSAQGRPLLGICLGMQLLADASHEGGLTRGLGLIPGEVVSLGQGRWHIGWNSVEKLGASPLFDLDGGDCFYFNHSYVYRGADEYQLCRTRFDGDFAAMIGTGKTVGIQFHPEKSQIAGHALLQKIVRRLCDA
ncbi:imidazole glycerol phosphate synthase subunit HisH [uncultured Propionivibrio sp.]|uniref:imidazole glycerol phosphate synthase subunit HisH n=1 Tax=uncultured Propionivibrio sp. TaxID=426737 RepID=UPI0029C0123E|nr:imidazole glycerol phosphate synthase subunit HisH [uncultured Propionivibrio sp.]